MKTAQIDELADDATHAAMKVLVEHGLTLNGQQIDELNFAITNLMHELVDIDDDDDDQPPRDGEVLGVEVETGYVIQWDKEHGTVYTPGKTVDEFGRDNLTPRELARVEFTGKYYSLFPPSARQGVKR